LKASDRTGHSGVAARFGQYFAKTGRVESILGRKLREAMEARADADYNPNRRASREDAERLLADATEFLQAIKALFENRNRSAILESIIEAPG